VCARGRLAPEHPVGGRDDRAGRAADRPGGRVPSTETFQLGAGTLPVARSIYRHLLGRPSPFWPGTGIADITQVRPDIVIEII
jgi:hypothetical protein